MRNAIILHGTCSENEYYSSNYPSPSNSHWIPWLQNELMIRDIKTYTPEVYKGFIYDYEDWKYEFEKNNISSETILIAHSSGVGFILRWLSENLEINVDKVILVAPWLNLHNTEESNTFFKFKMDSNLVSRCNKFLVISSLDDDEDILDSVKLIQKNIKNVSILQFKDKGHFTKNSLGTEEFPELLKEILN